jgi:hypothetical protein
MSSPQITPSLTSTTATDPSETVFHLRVGDDRKVELVRIADHLLVEVDEDGYVAGFWLTGVPPFPGVGDA